MKTRILFILLAASSLFACSEEGSEGGDDMHPFFQMITRTDPMISECQSGIKE
jgi:hypothetical protein